MSGEVDFVETTAPKSLRIKRREVTESLELVIGAHAGKVRLEALRHEGDGVSKIFEVQVDARSAMHLANLLMDATRGLWASRQDRVAQPDPESPPPDADG